jgi:hypothetical protein
MNQSWHEMNQLLTSIHQEYRVISQELARTTDSQRAIQLRALACACVADYLEAMQQYRVAKQRGIIVSP